jgi:hypothetical protein
VLDKKSGGVGVLDLMPCTQVSRATFRRRFGQVVAAGPQYGEITSEWTSRRGSGGGSS